MESRFSLPAIQRLLRPWVVVLVASIVYLANTLATYDGDPLAFVTLPHSPATMETAREEGYDGQYTYAIALNPLRSPSKLDVPAYRLQRILLPVLAWALSAGQPALAPWALVLINLLSLVVGVWALEALLLLEGASRWHALIYGLFGGVFMSVRLSLNEPLAYGLVILGMLLERRGRLWWSFAALGAAALAKETALTFVMGYGLWMVLQRNWKAAGQLALTALVPFIAWQGALTLWLGTPGIGSGGRGSSPFEAIPFMGYLRIFEASPEWRTFLGYTLLIVPLAIGPSLWGVWQGGTSVIRGSSHPASWALLVNATLIAATPFSTMREPLGLLRFLPGLVVSTIWFSAHFKKRRMLIYALIWLATLAFVFISG